MAKANHHNKVREALEALKGSSYVVRRRKAYKRKTFLVEPDILEYFCEVLEARKLRITYALNEALVEWADKHK